MSEFMIDKAEYGRTIRVLDVQAFTAALAKAMGGTYVKPKPDDMGAGERYASFTLDGCEVGISRDWRNGEKINVGISPLDVKLSYNETPRGDEYKLPSASMTATRPLERLAKEIKRRVVDPAKAPVAKRREYHAMLVEKANNLATTADRLRAKYPGLDVKLNNGETYSGSLYRNRTDEPYLSGRVYSDGTVSVDRLGTLSAAQFARFMKALYSEDA